MTASMGFKMVEFETQQTQTIKYEYQADEASNPKKQIYDVFNW